MYRRTTPVISIITAAFAVALVVSVMTPATAMAAPRAESPFGLNSHMLWGYSHTTIDRELDSLQAAGAGWLRIDVSWRGIETAKGAYDANVLANLDYVVTQAAAHGIRVAPVVLAVPDWANGNKGTWTPPTNDADFGDFMRYLAARYAGRITYWELGNEVNESGFWATGRDPVRYTSFLKAGYVGTKAGNPDAKVITAGLAGADFGYVREMYEAGAKGYFDIIGIHPYTNGRSPYAEDANYPGQVYGGMANVKAVMDSFGDTDKTIWATELGWQTSTSGSHVTEAEQATYIYDSYKRLYEQFPYVTTIFIYGLRNDGTDAAAPIDNYGLLRQDFTAKPAYAAFRGAYDAFQSGATPTTTSTTSTSVSLTPSKGKVRRGKTVTLSGTVRTSITTVSGAGVTVAPATITRTVVLQKRVGTRWATVKRITTSSGRFAVKVKMGKRGLNRYRVIVAGTRAVSRTVRVRVR